ncbi:hypothetical protein OEW28_05375 [Defluviimonas sp. WL0002]|uniref:DUF2029 domain-containing protein n=1 Tax=Albidovulum marisflavi TaxID=2984159 RepID=A0ABT2ZAF1_9RHOB|nr:hypothetical protein [Defluviimonas sp. WL0002]MCV2868053.1 hypothetical protein [Defluviimonas sp. WL0002]
MNRTQLWRLSGFSVALIAIVAALTLFKGGLYLAMHEGDAIHLADIVLRMAAGEWPHLDFMTPLGVLSAAPIALFVKLGFGIGHAFLLAQILVAVLIAPAAIRVAATRLDGLLAYAFVGYVLVLCIALVHGGDTTTVSLSMHYNRWSWAIAYVVLLQVLIAPRDTPAQVQDGIVLGLGLAALALIKMTYFVAFAPVVLVGLITRKWWRTLLVAVLAGLLVMAVVTLVAGPRFWLAYLADLLTVATSTVRERPGDELSDILGGSAYLAGNLALIGTVIIARKAGHLTEGLLLLLLYIPFAYVVYQNFGNDPQWIVLVLICLVALWREDEGTRSLGLRPSQWTLIAAGVFVGAGYASVQNLLISPVKHLNLQLADMRPLLGGAGPTSDLFANRSRMVRTRAIVALDGPEWQVASLAADEEDGSENRTVLPDGEILPDCTLQGGFTTWLAAAADDLERNGYAGKAVMAADILSSFWTYGDLARVERAAPWYYGRLSGLAQSDYLLIPLCPISGKARKNFLEEMERKGWTMTEVHRTPLYILMDISASVSEGNASDAR